MTIHPIIHNGAIPQPRHLYLRLRCYHAVYDQAGTPHDAPFADRHLITFCLIVLVPLKTACEKLFTPGVDFAACWAGCFTKTRPEFIAAIILTIQTYTDYNVKKWQNFGVVFVLSGMHTCQHKVLSTMPAAGEVFRRQGQGIFAPIQ